MKGLKNVGWGPWRIPFFEKRWEENARKYANEIADITEIVNPELRLLRHMNVVHMCLRDMPQYEWMHDEIGDMLDTLVRDIEEDD